MTFLKDQLGEDELRLLLERMDAFSDDAKVSPLTLVPLKFGVMVVSNIPHTKPWSWELRAMNFGG